MPACQSVSLSRYRYVLRIVYRYECGKSIPEIPSCADFFAAAIEDTDNLLVPVISIYEVYKRLYQRRGRSLALEAVGSMQFGRLLELDANLAVEAAEFSADGEIPMADSIIYTLARANGATLWTQDSDLGELAGVRFQEMKR